MTQRSITSFFLPKAKKSEESDVKLPSTPKKEAGKDGSLSDEPDGDSPIKPQRKGRLYIESDSEEESPAARPPAAAGTGRAATAREKASGPEKSAAAAPGPSSADVHSPPLRKTARKTTGGKKSLENTQKERLEKLRASVERDVRDETETNSRKSAAKDTVGATENKAEVERPKSDTKENVQPDPDSLTHIGEKPADTSEKADLASKETSSSKPPSTKAGSKAKTAKGKQKASPSAGKAKTGRKRASSGDPGQKRAKKKSLTSSDESAQQTERMDTGEGGSEEKEEAEMKKEEEEGKIKEEKATKGKPAESAPRSSAAVGTGIFGLQRKQSSGSAEADENAYDPAKKRYHPVKDAVWKQDQGVPFLALARTFDLIEGTSARLKMVDILANYFRSVIALSPSDLLPSVYLCLNKLAPAYEGIELGIGEQAITKAIAGATGRTADKIKIDAAEKGDLALVAEASKSRQKLMFRPAPLTVAGVFRALRDIARLSGHAVQQQKVAKMQGLLVACRHSETRFVVRALSGKLRIGLAEQSALQALSQACAQTPPDQPRPAVVLDALVDLPTEKAKTRCDRAALVLKTTYCECPSYDEIVPVLLEHGIDALPEHCKIRPGVPLKPMLAHPTRGVSEVLTRFENAAFTCEYKYDGERAQIHLLEDGAVRIYSRNQEDNTSKYPDIIARFPACLGEDVKSCILDSEAVAWDTEKQSILPFQVLSTRKRKDAVAEDIKVKVCVFAFDLLMLNGESLVKEPFETRRGKLRSAFKEVEGEFVFAKSNDSTNVEEIAEFLDESIKGNCEGLMVKTLQKDATYEIAKRSRNWLKLKKDYLDGVGDTIDVVVIGGFLGKGKRAGRYGGFLLACYDAENEEFQSVCKIGTGFSDEDLQTHSSYFGQHRIDAPKPYYRYAIEPDHWFDACQVWEIKCADLSISPVHKAAVGIVDRERGISLRFPRFLRVRDDKEPEAATSAQQIASMYRNQDQVKNQTAGGDSGKVDEEDFY